MKNNNQCQPSAYVQGTIASQFNRPGVHAMDHVKSTVLILRSSTKMIYVPLFGLYTQCKLLLALFSIKQ
jgi:hypothetical protein